MNFNFKRNPAILFNIRMLNKIILSLLGSVYCRHVSRDPGKYLSRDF